LEARIRKLKSLIDDPALLFLFVAGVFGVIFVFLFPPFQVIDEPSHFFRAYQIAEGHLVGFKDDREVGGPIPESVATTAGRYGYLIGHYYVKSDPRLVTEDLHRKLNPDTRMFGTFRNTVIYPPVSYLPQVLGIGLSRIFQASPLVSLYCARLATLAFWLLCVYWTIKLLPFGKWVAFSAALFPMMLSQAASASADGTIYALCFLAVGLILHLVQLEQYRPKLLAAVFAVGVALALTKFPYVLVMLFALALPAGCFPRRFGKPAFLLALYASIVILVGVWNYTVAPIHIELRSDTSTTGQLSTIVHRPLVFLKAVRDYPLTMSMDTTLAQVYGQLGWNDIRLPGWLIGYGFLTVFIGLLAPGARGASTRTRLLALLPVLAIVGTVTVLIYLTWDIVGYPAVYGLWGRYFDPLLILVVPLGVGLLTLNYQSWDRAKRFLAISAPIALLVVTFLVWNRYYYHLNLI
jgi:uncharacterized membrane protein